MTDQLESKIINLCVAYIPVGVLSIITCIPVGKALLWPAFHALILIVLNSNSIRPNLFRGSLAISLS